VSRFARRGMKLVELEFLPNEDNLRHLGSLLKQAWLV
jgi:hypothetical protein